MKQLLTDRWLALVAALLLAVGVLGTVGAASQLGQPFPGFLVLGNRVVASVGLSLWPATAGGEIFQQRVVEANGRDVLNARELREIVAAHPPGTEIRWGFEATDGVVTERGIETRTFGARDFALLHGTYLVNGIALGLAALIALGARRRFRGALAAFPLMAIGSLWVLSAMDLYGPYRLFRLHVLCEALLWPAALHMALAYPAPVAFIRGRVGSLAGLYGAALLVGVVTEVGLGDSGTYTKSHLLSVSAFGAALLVLVVATVERIRSPQTPGEHRARALTVAVGGLVALSLPVALTLAEAVTGGRAPQNALALTGFVFPLSVAWAVARDVPPREISKGLRTAPAPGVGADG